jgi:hypothetical protein
MSVPINQLVFAGTWDVAERYAQFWFVISPIDSKCYVNVNVQPITGGTDPSVQPSTYWVLIPPPVPSGGGVQSVNQLNSGIGGVTVDNTDPDNPILSWNAIGGDSIEIRAVVGSPDGEVEVRLDLPNTGAEEGQVQYNSSGLLTGATGVTTDGISLTVSGDVEVGDTLFSGAITTDAGDLQLTADSGIVKVFGLTSAGLADLPANSSSSVAFEQGGPSAGKLTLSGTDIVFSPQFGLSWSGFDPMGGNDFTISNASIKPAFIKDSTNSTGLLGQVPVAVGNKTWAWGSPKQATYYKTAVQNLTNSAPWNTDITFDAVGSWNNDGGYITHTSGSSDFTVVQTGLYQLEFNGTVLVNNGTWSTTANRVIAIDITRPSLAEQGVIVTTSLQAVQSYAIQTAGSFYLIAGDVINCRINNAFTLGTPTPPQAQCLTNTFDLNTFFTWRFIS